MTTPLAARLTARIEESGPMTVAAYMAACLFDPADGYYARHAGIGRDFTTAPEISQVFGELIGLWCAQTWVDLGAPAVLHLIEIGGGRGALMDDALRAARALPPFREALRVTFVELNPDLAAAQAAVAARHGVPAQIVPRLAQAPAGDCVIIGNEILDCLPIRQFVRTETGWRERLVGISGGALAFGLGPEAPSAPAFAPSLDLAPGQVLEAAPGLEAFVDEIAGRLTANRGRALFFDYGPDASEPGDTLQAIWRGAKTGPLAAPGESDLTARVDFAQAKAFAMGCGLVVHGPATQGAWLSRLGGAERAERLARPDVIAAYRRLADADQMGALFKAICLATPGLPDPPGFSP